MPKKVQQYENERREILQKIFNILDITDTNRIFSLNQLDSNQEKQNQILNLEYEIRKYFVHANWTCFKKPCKRRYLSFAKYVMKDFNFKLQKISGISKNDEKNEYFSFYKII